MNRLSTWFALSLGGIAVLIGLLWLLARNPAAASPDGGRLTVFAAAGLRTALDPAFSEYRRQTGVVVQVQYGGSGDMFAQLRTMGAGDLLISADSALAEQGAKEGVLREILPLTTQRAVLCVRRGNPKGLRSLADLQKPGVRFGLGNVELVQGQLRGPAIGVVTRKALTTAGQWDAISAAATMRAPTVPELASAVELGSLDAAIVWDATVRLMPALDVVAVPELQNAEDRAVVAIAAASFQPRHALHLARWLTAPDQGGPILARGGQAPIAGDAWAERPRLLMFNGTVNKPAIEASIAEFAAREGVDIDYKYDGCGALCAEMLARPDAAHVPDIYIACDVCFVPQVAHFFPEAIVASETDLIIAVAKGNPHGIAGLADLAKPGLRVGLGKHSLSSLGLLSKRFIEEAGLSARIQPNVAAEHVTADQLLVGLLTGHLDAVIVYNVTIQKQLNRVQAVSIPGAKAVQPYAISAVSKHRALAGRLLAYLLDKPERYAVAGFRPRQLQTVQSRFADPRAPAMPGSANSIGAATTATPAAAPASMSTASAATQSP